MGFSPEYFVDAESSAKYGCTACSKILDDPVMCPRCAAKVCRGCCAKDEGDVGMEEGEESLICPCCRSASCVSTEVTLQLAQEVNGLEVRCPQAPLGCPATMSLELLRNHVISECQHTVLHCPHEGCTEAELDRTNYEAHVTVDCEYRLVVCVACGTRLAQRDLCTHQQQRSCFYQLQRRRMVQSQQETTERLKTHRMKILQARHATEQMERRLLKQHTQVQQKALRRVNSAPAVRLSLGMGLLGAMGSYRVGSAIPHFSKNLQQSSLSTPMATTRPYTSGGGFGSGGGSRVARPMSCRRCTARFAPSSNKEDACQWHRGPMVDQFGGTCVNCGRWRTVDGCQTGFHTTK